MKKLMLVLLLLSTPFAYAEPASTKLSQSVIKIDKKNVVNNINGETVAYRRFTFCEVESNPSSCRVLGHKKWYKRSALVRQEVCEGAHAVANTFETFFFGSCTVGTLLSTTLTGGATLVLTGASVTAMGLCGSNVVHRVGNCAMIGTATDNEIDRIDLSSDTSEDAYQYAVRLEQLLEKI